MTGINIQWPISELILSRRKTIETRTYRLPVKYVGKPLLLIETPGPKGKFKARVVATIIFQESFKYDSPKAFYRDQDKHFVDQESDWAWKEKPKWGWPIKSVKLLKKAFPAPRNRGIVFAKLQVAD